MQRFSALPLLLLLLVLPCRGQAVAPAADPEFEKGLLLSDLRALEAESLELRQPLAQAVARAAIADAAWALDRAWAKKLLTEAYELTLPKDDAQAASRARPVGAAPTPPTDDDRDRNDARNRVLSVAGRDRAFADQLARLGAERLGPYEDHFRHASLAAQSLRDGEVEAAGNYILRALEADPTQITAGMEILNVAARDRKAADLLIVQYVERLRRLRLSLANESAIRTYYILQQIIFPGPATLRDLGPLQPAGAAAVRAYVGYVVESMERLEQEEPGSARMLRPFLLAAWPPLRQHAPDLAGAFLQLERRSRPEGDDTPLPQSSREETGRATYEERVKRAIESGQPDDFALMSAMGRGDFEAARKMIDLLPEGEPKRRYAEALNTEQAVALASKGDIQGAEKFAARLTKAASAVRAYAAIIGRCVADKNQACVTAQGFQALKQLARAEDPSALPLAYSGLARAVAGADRPLALEALEEAVRAANGIEAETAGGRVGLDTEVFKLLARSNEARARQAANSLKDRLQRIAALASIYQWKAKELTAVAVKPPPPAAKP